MYEISQTLGALLAQRGIADSDYDGSIVTLPDAVIYAKNKIRTRERRSTGMKGSKWLVKQGTTRVGSAVGATVGAVGGTAVAGPAGTVVGGAAGAVVGNEAGKVVGNVSVNTVGRIGRGLKYTYKRIRGTRGVNREKAAEILLMGYRDFCFQPLGDDLAPRALDAIFEGDDWRTDVDHCMNADRLDDAIPVVAKRLRSTTNKFFG